MPIIFENIDTGETVAIDNELEGKHYRAKLTAVMNSSNLSPNADRGQDYGWRLAPEQQALIEEWESSGEMIDKVSNFTRVPSDNLTHGEFLSYLLHTQEAGKSQDKKEIALRRERQAAYDARVNELRAAEEAEVLAPFTLEDLATEEKAKLDAAETAAKEDTPKRATAKK